MKTNVIRNIVVVASLAGASTLLMAGPKSYQDRNDVGMRGNSFNSEVASHQCLNRSFTKTTICRHSSAEQYADSSLKSVKLGTSRKFALANDR
ncbi:Uncharacterised protein [BD1-7 clade bacterium]|uniref:Uncharacterized protein n=1 Tax=BD1-7 clade bacterium TaxID=2029982 RepID=A0A5S9QRG6_9GAMM|nr:Uncharacterised protein [BD1-7 clade bacterium]CAA0121964.1 Uncharacterised protein [BD1-7 clade bacterium]